MAHNANRDRFPSTIHSNPAGSRLGFGGALCWRCQHPSARLRWALLALLCLSLPACGLILPEGRRLEAYLGPGWPKPNNAFHEASLPALRAELPVVEGAEYVDDDDACGNCHESLVESFRQNVHRGIRQGESCEACHGPGRKHIDTEGRKPGLVWSFKTLSPVQRSEICARCHEADACAAGAQWRTSVHAHRGLSCLDCHTAHHERAAEKSTAKNLGATAPSVCYRCHGDMADLQRIAGPHQVGGPNGFNCTTCHDAHGKIRQTSRQDLCLSCHQSHSPTMAWHSSTHGIAGVACTDCHNPHPRPGGWVSDPTGAPSDHATVKRPPRRPMSVHEPEACFKCHPQAYALTNLPSHHPLAEGKMTCTDCHDPHGEAEKGLLEPTVNQLCYRCHAEKQGPFAYEHAPVTEDCGICHEPHGSVTNSLLRQPATFLCLRCHSGHRSDHRPVDAAGTASLRQALYGDCTQCHAQVHGTDHIGESLRGSGLTR